MKNLLNNGNLQKLKPQGEKVFLSWRTFQHLVSYSQQFLKLQMDVLYIYARPITPFANYFHVNARKYVLTLLYFPILREIVFVFAKQ